MEANRIDVEPLLQVVPDPVLEPVPLDDVVDVEPSIQNPMTLATPFDSDRPTSYKWTDIQQTFGTSNVPNARWMPQKLVPLFQGLDAPSLIEGSRCARFGAQMLSRYKQYCIDGGNSYESFADAVRDAFSPMEAEESSASSGFGVTRPDTTSIGLVTFDQQSNALVVGDSAIASLILRAVEAGKEARQAELAYNGLSDAQRQQEIVADEVRRYTEAQEAKKKEYDLRLKVQQTLNAQIDHS